MVTMLGCSSMKLPSPSELDVSLKGVKKKRPTSIIAFWKPAYQTIPNGKPIRGFGGRLQFINDEKKTTPLRVEGDLTVYVFDASVDDPEKTKPLRIYEFLAQDLSDHYTKSDLGHVYDFWIPIDEIGNEEQQLCLISRFDGVDGNLIFSDHNYIHLPGRSSKKVAEKKQAADRKDREAIAQVSYQKYRPETGGGEMSRDHRRTERSTTIRATPNFTRHILGSSEVPDKSLPARSVESGGRAPVKADLPREIPEYAGRNVPRAPVRGDVRNAGFSLPEVTRGSSSERPERTLSRGERSPSRGDRGRWTPPPPYRPEPYRPEPYQPQADLPAHARHQFSEGVPGQVGDRPMASELFQENWQQMPTMATRAARPTLPGYEYPPYGGTSPARSSDPSTNAYAGSGSPYASYPEVAGSREPSLDSSRSSPTRPGGDYALGGPPAPSSPPVRQSLSDGAPALSPSGSPSPPRTQVVYGPAPGRDSRRPDSSRTVFPDVPRDGPIASDPRSGHPWR
jgi:hypothetical protein